LVSKLDDLLSILKASAVEEVGGVAPETFKPLVDKIEQLIEANKRIVESNEAMLSTIGEIEKRLRKPPLPPMPPIPTRRPLPPPKS
jgi:hypothetical protein